ncbi:hypothetical protein BSZ36_14190 [Rubricoccus marinus]|uniref:Uncharacterized protein n=1 Tax=Rubricoccus marinus TaxID=716817 RepID=A0A259U222_9BACT|nr:hypothetical protein BSZ36_14190 [Rubricoccus marinus]
MPAISAVATGAFSLSRRVRVIEVDITVGPIVISALVRGGRVALPFLRGTAGVRFADPATEAHARRAAIEAARADDSLGWVA